MRSYPSAEKQSVYSTAPADWARYKDIVLIEYVFTAKIFLRLLWEDSRKRRYPRRNNNNNNDNNNSNNNYNNNIGQNTEKSSRDLRRLADVKTRKK